MKILPFLLALTTYFKVAGQGYATDYPGFLQAAAEKKYQECIDRGTQLLTSMRHPNVLYKLAECYCQADSATQSIKLLQELAIKGLPYPIADNPKLAAIAGSSDFKTVAAKFKTNRKSIHNSTDAFTLTDAGLIPEGMAATSDATHFFVGSLAQHKIVEYAFAAGEKDLVQRDQYGIWMVLGMKVTSDNKSLWVCSASENDSINGYSGIFGFDLASGRLINKFIVDNKNGPHLFNDLAIAGDSLLYFTDSKAGQVWKMALANGTISPVSAGPLTYPNGIALDPEASTLYVADFIGIKQINLLDGRVTVLQSNTPTYLNQIDGLYYYKHSLIAIQDSGNNDDRIVRFYLDKGGQTIDRVQVLQSFHPDFVIPTTGVIVKNEFYYIANSQLRNLQPDGSITNAAQLKKPLIKKLRLN